MICDIDPNYTCPEATCGNIKFTVCDHSYTLAAPVSDRCPDLSKLNCNDPSLSSCFAIHSYVHLHGVNNSLIVENPFVVCEVDESLPPPVPSPSPAPQSAATINNANFILAFMFVFLLAASFSKR